MRTIQFFLPPQRPIKIRTCKYFIYQLKNRGTKSLSFPRCYWYACKYEISTEFRNFLRSRTPRILAPRRHESRIWPEKFCGEKYWIQTSASLWSLFFFASLLRREVFSMSTRALNDDAWSTFLSLVHFITWFLVIGTLHKLWDSDGTKAWMCCTKSEIQNVWN